MTGFIIVLASVIVAIVWGLRVARKRRSDMSELADQLGLQFDPERNYRTPQRYAFLDKLRQGSNQYAYNIMTGGYKGYEVTAFDYHYETYSTDVKERRKTHHHHFSFFILKLEKYFPELTIAKDGLLSKGAQKRGCEDIEFESQEFSRTFVVRSKDKKFACDFCNARMIEYLLGHTDMNIEVEKDSLALGYTRCLNVEEIETHLNNLAEIRSLMPNSLFETQV